MPRGTTARRSPAPTPSKWETARRERWRCSPAGHGCGSWRVSLRAIGDVFEKIARLAIQRPADGFEGAETDRPDLAGLEQRQVGHRNAHPLRQFRQRHFLPGQLDIEIDADAHFVSPALESMNYNKDITINIIFITKKMSTPGAGQPPDWRRELSGGCQGMVSGSGGHTVA